MMMIKDRNPEDVIVEGKDLMNVSRLDGHH
jgi:hypothetical protein